MDKRTIEKNWTPNSKQTLTDFIKEQPYNTKSKLTYRFEDGREEAKEERLALTNENKPIRMKKGSSKSGYYLNTKYLKKVSYKILSPLGEQINFDKKCKKIIGMLNESGLWPDIKLEITIMMNLGYKRCLEIKEKGKKTDTKKLFSETNEEIFNKAYEEHKEIFEEMKDSLKNPEEKQALEKRIRKIKEISNNGTEAFLKKLGEPDYFSVYSILELFYYIDNKIKKMVFHKQYGKEKTIRILNEINEAIKNKKEYRVTSQNGYDVSFHYDPELNKAWYSEEYKNCGNGHYYLALNATHAWFYEDD